MSENHTSDEVKITSIITTAILIIALGLVLEGHHCNKRRMAACEEALKAPASDAARTLAVDRLCNQ